MTACYLEITLLCFRFVGNFRSFGFLDFTMMSENHQKWLKSPKKLDMRLHEGYISLNKQETRSRSESHECCHGNIKLWEQWHVTWNVLSPPNTAPHPHPSLSPRVKLGIVKTFQILFPNALLIPAPVIMLTVCSLLISTRSNLPSF